MNNPTSSIIKKQVPVHSVWMFFAIKTFEKKYISKPLQTLSIEALNTVPLIFSFLQ